MLRLGESSSSTGRPPGQPSEVTRSNCFTAELSAPGPARVQETRCNYASKRKYFGTDWPGSLELRCSSNRVFPEECERDRKSTRLNSSHSQISYAVFCLKKKKKKEEIIIAM